MTTSAFVTTCFVKEIANWRNVPEGATVNITDGEAEHPLRLGYIVRKAAEKPHDSETGDDAANGRDDGERRSARATGGWKAGRKK